MSNDDITMQTTKRVSDLEAKVTGINTRLDGVERSNEQIVRSINSLSDKITSRGTDWKALSGWAGVVVAVMIALGGLSLEPLKVAAIELKEWQYVTIQNRYTKADHIRYAKEVDEEIQKELGHVDEKLMLLKEILEQKIINQHVDEFK